MEVQIKRHRNPQKGVGLFIALFALMLLSAIGLAMVYAADTETSIDSNFRDQQRATYAAISGLQEARDRLYLGSTIINGGSTTTSVAGKLTWPTDLPSTSAKNIIYIINPKNVGDVVEPWNPNNRYYDWELCSGQEQMPAGFCNTTNHTPPTGNAWYLPIDDSDATQGSSWHRNVPLDFKWVRINLKSNNMVASVPVTSSSDASLVCWSGTGQIDQPAGYDKTCSPDGSLAGINLPTGVVNYSSTPTVTIAAPPSGTTAVAHALVTSSPPGTVSTPVITNPGANYTTVPTVTIVGGGGSGATAIATIVPASSHPLLSVDLIGNGATPGCFASSTAPSVTITPTNGGSGATAAATMNTTASCVKSWSVNGTCGGSAFKNATLNVTTGDGGGSGFAGQITTNGSGKVTGFTIQNPGTGYSSVPTGSNTTVVGGCLTVSYTMGYEVASVHMTAGGSGYIGTPTVSLSPVPQVGSMPNIQATISSSTANAGQVVSLTVTNGGNGYTSTPTVVFTGGGGTGAAGTVSIAGTTTINGFDFTCSGCTPGTGYLTAPVVTISGGGGPTVTTTGVLGGTTYYGQVVQVTSYAETPTLSARQGSRAMMQEELSTGLRFPFQFSIGGAITLPGPNPNFGTPNSNNFYVKGTDAASCGGTSAAKPSIDVYDPTNSDAVDNMIGQLARTDHYPGLNASPDVENGTGITGNPTPSNLDAFINDLLTKTPSSQQMLSTPTLNPDPSTFQTFTLTNANMNPTNPPYTFVQGNATISGNVTGSGILVVTGSVSFSGNYTFNGLILVVGQGSAVYNGGGNGIVNGSLYVAKTRDSSGALMSSLGAPTLDYSGGGGNGVQYDHCKADALLGNIAQTPPPPDSNPLTVISQRTIYR